MNIFAKASRIKLRFESTRGLLTVEDLWSLKLSSVSSTAVTLDTLAVDVHEKAQKAGKVSFVGKSKTASSNLDELRLEILKEIIAVKEAEDAAESLREENRTKREKALEELARRKDVAITQMSDEELEAMAKL